MQSLDVFSRQIEALVARPLPASAGPSSALGSPADPAGERPLNGTGREATVLRNCPIYLKLRTNDANLTPSTESSPRPSGSGASSHRAGTVFATQVFVK